VEAQTSGREVRFASGPLILAGWLQLPPEGVDPWGTVVYLHGSGPQDREGNNPQATLNVFAPLAADAAAIGLASLRFDKRGVGGSSGDTLQADIHDLAGDAHAAVRFVRRLHETAQRPVFLVGHGEGSTLALLEAASNPDIVGLVLLSPVVRDMQEVLRMQAAVVQRAIEALRPEERQQMSIPPGYDQIQATEQFIAAIQAAPRDIAVAEIMGQTVPVRWFRSYFHLDIPSLLPNVRCPLLALTGSKDGQVPAEDALRLAELVRGAGSPDATGEIVPDLTHILRRSTGPGDMSEYPGLVQQPIDEGLRRRIADWLQAHRPEEAPRDPETENRPAPGVGRLSVE
jgi:hypothetical protein